MSDKTVIWAAILAVGIAACSRGQRYELRGQVLAVNRDRQELTVKHEDIRGFMPGMTMPFRVADRKQLEGRAPGELITATLVIGNNEAYLERIKHVGEAPLAADATVGTSRSDLDMGQIVPDERFVDQTGASRKLSDWRDKVVAVTFIYTRCPLPDFCPLMDRHFRTVQERVDRDPLLRGRVQLLSVSFDPTFDTPPVLAAHAKRVSADTSSWSFLTGDVSAIDRFGARFGVSVIREGKTAAEIVHNLRTAVIDGEGRLVKVFNGNDWKPDDLVTELRNAVDRR